jgi:hypothetical protein
MKPLLVSMVVGLLVSMKVPGVGVVDEEEKVAEMRRIGRILLRYTSARSSLLTTTTSFSGSHCCCCLNAPNAAYSRTPNWPRCSFLRNLCLHDNLSFESAVQRDSVRAIRYALVGRLVHLPKRNLRRKHSTRPCHHFPSSPQPATPYPLSSPSA